MEEVFKMKLILLLSFALLTYILITRWLTGKRLLTVPGYPVTLRYHACASFHRP